LRIVTGYLTGDDLPFPDRVHLSVLLATFELELFNLIERRTWFGRAKISSWPTTRDLGNAPEPGNSPSDSSTATACSAKPNSPADQPYGPSAPFSGSDTDRRSGTVRPSA